MPTSKVQPLKIDHKARLKASSDALEELFSAGMGAAHEETGQVPRNYKQPWKDYNGEWHYPAPEEMEYESAPHHFDETGTPRDEDGKQILLKASKNGSWLGNDFFYMSDPWRWMPSQDALHAKRFPPKHKNVGPDGKVRRGRPLLSKRDAESKFGSLRMPSEGGDPQNMLSILLSKLRIDHGLTQGGLAAKTGMATIKISQAENGAGGIGEENVNILASIFGLTAGDRFLFLVADSLRRRALPKLSAFETGPQGLRSVYVTEVVHGMLELCTRAGDSDLKLVRDTIMSVVEAARVEK